MKNEYSQHLRDVIEYSREEAERLQNSYIGPEHLLLAIIRDGAGLAYDVLGRFLTIPNVKKRIEEQIKSADDFSGNVRNISISKLTERVLRLTILEAKNFHRREADTEHLVLAILKEKNNMAARFLLDEGLSYELFFREFSRVYAERGEQKTQTQEDMKISNSVIQKMMKTTRKRTTASAGATTRGLRRATSRAAGSNRSPLPTRRSWTTSVRT